MAAQIENHTGNGRAQVIVATSVMLSFMSFWRAAAIVLNDLGSSAYYVGGIAEKAIGQAAPWFILAVMLFSYAVRAVYVESCAMFTRGGVYRVVKEAMGGTLARLSVSALMLTISSLGRSQVFRLVSTSSDWYRKLRSISDIPGGPQQSQLIISPRSWRCWSRSTSGGATLGASMNPQ